MIEFASRPWKLISVEKLISEWITEDGQCEPQFIWSAKILIKALKSDGYEVDQTYFPNWFKKELQLRDC